MLLITGSFPPLKDGVGDYCAHLARWISDGDAGWGVHVLTSCGCDVGSAGKAVVHPEIRDWGWSGLPSLLRSVWRIDPDVVHVQYPALGYSRHLMPTLLPAILRSLGRWRVAVTIHGFGLYTVMGKIRLAVAATGSHAIVPVSDHIRTSACSFFRRSLIFAGNVRKMVQAIYVASSIEPPERSAVKRTEALRRSWGIKPGEIAIVFFGFINEGKGFDDLLLAVSICRDQGFGCRLICMAELDPGRDGYHAQIGALISELRLDDLTIFTGYLERGKAAECLMAADVAALPFNYGASTKRSSLLAALACGLPVITTSDRSLPPFFVDGQNISLVPPKDPNALAAAIRKLGEDRPLRLKLRRGAIQLSRRFSWGDIAGRHRELYERLVGPGAGDVPDGKGGKARCGQG